MEIFTVKDGNRVLIYQRIPVTPSGVNGTLIGYKKNRKIFWY